MNWGRFALAALAAGVVASFTDWLFMGVLFHAKYNAYPEVWRKSVASGADGKAVAWSTVLGLVTCSAFIFTCQRLHLYNYDTTLKLALAVWVIAPLPIVITNALFIKMHPALVFSHSLGWLAKLVVAALAVVLILAR